MKSQQIFATLMVAMLVMGTLFAVGKVGPLSLSQAAAQTAGVSIKTSADSHGGNFFGGALQVVITDPNKDDSDTVETIQVDIEGKNNDGQTTTETFDIHETSKNSKKFEFYLVSVNSTLGPSDIDPINSEGICTVDGGTCSPGGADSDLAASFITFGSAGADLGADIDQFTKDSQFTITYQDSDISVDYDDSDAELTVDRESAEYGTNSTMHLTINDQDANIDPTHADSITFTSAEMDDLVALVGGEWDGDVTFDETGDNTAKFEADIVLNNVDDGNDDEIHYTSDSVQLTLHDQVDYTDLSNTANDKTGTSSLSISITNEDGDVSTFGTVTFASELKFTITDNDQNRDSQKKDVITGGATVTTDSGDSETFNLKETGDDTSIFAPDITNNEVKITFLADGDAATDDNGLLELTPADTTEDITVTYEDPLDSDDGPNEFTQTFQIDLATPAVSLPDSVGINDDFTVTITDANLNDNPRTKDTYTVPLVGTSGDDGEDLERGGDAIGDWGTFEIEIQGEHQDFGGGGVTETLTETGVNTGIFEVTFDMNDLINSAGLDNIEDGDAIKVTFHDNFDDQTHEASDTLHIGKASENIDFSRTVLPIPPDAGDSVEDQLGATSSTTITVTDPDQNTQSNTEDQIEWCWEDEACATDQPSFRVEIDATGTDLDETISSLADYSGSTLEAILPGLNALALDETGKTTGVFDETLDFERGGLSTSDFQDLEVTITEIQTNGDENSAGITFRGNDAVVTMDKDSLRNGDVLTVTIQDEDLNLDDDTAEEFSSSNAPDEPYLFSIETEDDDVCGDTGQCPTTETFRETGKDTGVFTATWTIGDDIPVTAKDGEDIKQASNLHLTFNDVVDSTGRSGDEIETDLPVATSTGAISVQPELVGPGTEITVTVTDIDLNKDASGTDVYTPDDPNTDNFFVNFRSDRDEVQEASPKLTETGPNTGVFQFTIELKTDAQDCQDDDLSAAKYQATGGSSPSVGACPGDLISVRYEDEQGANGHSTVVSRVVEVKSYDPTFATDKESYAVGDKVTVTISDPDANHDPDVADSLTDVRVYSDSDQVGKDVSALETGKNTGVFKLSFGTSSDSSSGSITVKSGDDVTVQYTDDYPANFEDTEDDHKFLFNVPIGGAGAGGVGTTTPSSPIVRDVGAGKPLSSVQAGQQVVLATTVNNNVDQETPFVAIVEVRDSSGVTTYLQWQTGTLNAHGKSEVGISWTPDQAGSYTVRTFVISELAKPTILSPVQTSNVSVT